MKPQVRIWELQHSTICKVIGMAFDNAELKKIARRFKVYSDQFDGNQEFYLHAAIVGLCGKDNHLARYTEKLIEQRFAGYAKRLESQKSGRLIEMIMGAEEGETIPLWAVLWYLATRKSDDSGKVETTLFGHIHMLEHQLLKNFWDNERRCDEFQERQDNQALLKLKRDFLDLTRTLSELEQTNQALLARLAASEELVASLREKRSQELPVPDKTNERSQVKIRNLTFLLQEERDKNRELLDDCRRYREQLTASATALMEAERKTLIQEDTTPEVCPFSSEPCLQGERIALVGGFDGLEEHYRGAVEQLGGEFARHDGRCDHRGIRTLEDCICNASLVICPISVNSHFAATCVKRICKKRSISCCFPDSASVSCLRNTLEQHFSPNNAASRTIPTISANA